MISITGSGEYLDSIRSVDSVLLNKLDDPYVLTFPTAAGQESQSRIDYWSNLAKVHFSKLGVKHKDFQALNSEVLNSSKVLQEVEKANFIYFSGGNPNYLFSQIANTSFHEMILTIHKENGILAGCSAGAMIMGEKMIKGMGLGLIENSLIIPHYGESFYSWVPNTVKLLNRGKYKLICLEKDTYFVKTDNEIEIIGKQNVHVIFKDQHDTYQGNSTISLDVLKL